MEKEIGKYSKNLIFIIGNGFDLAHGMETGFNHFSDWLLDKIINEIYFSRENLDKDIFKQLKLLSRDFLYSFRKNFNVDPYRHEESIRKGCSYFSTKVYAQEIFRMTIENAGYLELTFLLRNQFLAKLFSNSYQNWFDIENAYFSELKRNLEPNSNSHQRVMHKSRLNKEFEDIKLLLVEYLNTIEIKEDKKIREFILRKITHQNFEKVYQVDFNYTKTIVQYSHLFQYTDMNHIDIHGSLKENNIIFGYGNDKDQTYQEMKKVGEDEYLEHFKTFQYLGNNKYSNLVNKLDELEDYEVMVLGHSLGMTDKTLLQEVLDDSKCKRIHLFKRRDLEKDEDKVIQEFNKLLYATSRIITDDRDLRNKVVNYEDDIYFP